MMELFTDRARTSLIKAREKAESLRHNYVGTEHILLGLLMSGGTAQRLLEEHDLSRPLIEKEIKALFGPDSGTTQVNQSKTSADFYSTLKKMRIRYPGASAIKWKDWQIETTLNEMGVRWWELAKTPIAEFDAKWKGGFISVCNDVLHADIECGNEITSLT